MRVVADREVCVGAGMCAFTEPRVFDQDDADGRVVLVVASPSRELLDSVRQAVELCPSGALSLEVSDDS